MYAAGQLPSQKTSSILSEVEVGKDYYVSVSLVELSEKNKEGEPWDSVSESGPDIFVEIYWKGNRIYRSTTKEDTFVAKWSNGELNLRSMALQGGRTSMDDVIKAARVNIKEEDEIEVRVYDADLVGNTLAGVLTLPLAKLNPGDTVYRDVSATVKRLSLRVTDMTQALDPLD